MKPHRVKPKVESIQNRRLENHLNTIANSTRTVHCPVRSHYLGQPTRVKEYLLPLDLLQTDQSTQVRELGKDQQIVSQLVDSMRDQGQNEGICIECVWAKKAWSFVIRWGSHRFDAANTLKQRALSIKLAPSGYIWANLYSYPPSELCRLQTIENNLTIPKKLAQDEDNIQSLCDAGAMGYLDIGNQKFVDLKEEEQRKQLEAYITFAMPAVKQRKGLISKFYKSTKSKVKTDTWSESASRIYFNTHYGLNTLGAEFKERGASRDRVIDQHGQRHALYIMNAQFTAGAKLQQMLIAKLYEKTADVVHLVWSMPVSQLGSGTDRSNARSQILSRLKKYNALFANGGKATDFLYILPQTKAEKSNNHKKPWVDIHSL